MRTLSVFDSSEDITSFVQGKIRVRSYTNHFIRDSDIYLYYFFIKFDLIIVIVVLK